MNFNKEAILKPEYYISPFERYAVWLMFLSHFLYFGILMFNLHFQVPFSSIISGLVTLTCFSAAVFLVVRDLCFNLYPRFTPSIYCVILFLLYYTAIFLIDNNVGTDIINQYTKTAGGKLYIGYVFYMIYFVLFLMFFANANRLGYILSKPMLVYVPSLVSVIIILIINNNALVSFNLHETYNMIDPSGRMGGVIRYVVRQPPIFLLTVSVYLMFFEEKKINRYVWGPMGSMLSILAFLISDSRSTMFAFALILVFYGIVSLRQVGAFLYATIVYVSVGITILPMLLMSIVFHRFSELQYIQDYNIADVSDFSRLDLIQWGLYQFAESPVFGGSIFLTNVGHMGGWSHCTPICILYSTGLVGLTLIIVICYGAIKGALALRKIYGIKAYWIYALFFAELTEMLFHGNTMHFFGGSIAVFLIANAIYMRRGGMPMRF